ncbi:MAG TPA: xanthine dehydrogenase family protein molybdopterin-binding subunit [Candidatus Dormibacteraeota bacterium]|nr:xanthine dehydrogenase family protein molybdopterin-binding subunit [Candidatus Dormibacteraeota bacterium]
MARIDALTKLTGQAVYAADVELPGLCHAAVARCPFPHARVVAVDPRPALEVPGVIGVFTATDLNGGHYGRRVRDIPLLAGPEARFAGERVVAVVAQSRVAAERAAARVRIDYEELPATLDAEEALEPTAPAVHEAPWSYPGAVVSPDDPPNLQSRVRHGAVEEAEQALARSAYVVDRTYRLATGHQGYLEPQACVARVDPDGHVHVWMANKSPYRLRHQLAECLGLDPGLIDVHPVAIGGDFGGKGSPMDAPLCVELARRTGRPVKLVERYHEDLTSTNPRHSGRVRVRIGCDEAGRLTGFQVDALFDGGAYAGFKPLPTVTLHGLEEIGSSYRVAAAAVEVRVCYTHTVPRGHMRAPGAPEAVFAFESALDELAQEAGLDPVEIRRRNLLADGEANPWGVRWVEARGQATLEAALDAYRSLPAPPGWRHGRGIAVYDRPTRPGRASLRLVPTGDRLIAETGLPEQGGGAHTVLRQGLAQALGIEADRVEVRQVSTAELPPDDGVGGSRVTATLSVAVAQAAEAFRAVGGSEPVTVTLDPATVPPVTSYCVQVAQVAVDPESGQVRVLELLTAADVAEVVNRDAHQLQIEGGAVMGYGLACLEDLALANGHVWAANLGEFRIPSPIDVPMLRTVLVPGGRGIGALGVKAVGELANVPTAAAIANAVADAVGVRVRDLPITAERVYQELVGRRRQVGEGRSQSEER